MRSVVTTRIVKAMLFRRWWWGSDWRIRGHFDSVTVGIESKTDNITVIEFDRCILAKLSIDEGAVSGIVIGEGYIAGIGTINQTLAF